MAKKRQTFGQLLKVKRDERGWSQETAANSVNCSKVWYGVLERDSAAPSPALASRLFKALKFSGNEREHVYELHPRVRPAKGRYARKAG